MQAQEEAHAPGLKTQRWGSGVFRHAFVPLLLALPILSWIYPAQIEHTLQSSSMHLGTTAALLWLTIFAIWIAEQIYPRVADSNYRLLSDATGWRRLGRDLFYLLFITQVTTLLIAAAKPHLDALFVSTRYGFIRAWWPGTAPFPLRVLLAFLLVELFDYWFHRACHRSSFLWRFHSTHHAVTELTGLKALRTHPVDNLFFYVVRSLPLLLLGVGVEEVAAVICFGGVLGILSHANIEVAEGPLGALVNFPSFHVVHHSSEQAESRANFGCHTVLWDRVFGTFRSSARAGMQIGVEPLGPRSAWRELIGPLYRSKM